MPRLLLSFKIYMKIYVSFRITKERSNLLITDALERGGGFADGVHLEWKEKSTLQMNTDKTFTFVREKITKQNKLTREVQSVQVLAEARETKVEIKIQAFIVGKKDGRL